MLCQSSVYTWVIRQIYHQITILNWLAIIIKGFRHGKTNIRTVANNSNNLKSYKKSLPRLIQQKGIRTGPSQCQMTVMVTAVINIAHLGQWRCKNSQLTIRKRFSQIKRTIQFLNLIMIICIIRSCFHHLARSQFWAVLYKWWIIAKNAPSLPLKNRNLSKIK